MIDIDIIVVWPGAQTRNRGKIPREHNDKSRSLRNPQVSNGDSESSRDTLGVGICRERVLRLSNANRKFAEALP
jgi:hypothetical protein